MDVVLHRLDMSTHVIVTVGSKSDGYDSLRSKSILNGNFLHFSVLCGISYVHCAPSILRRAIHNHITYTRYILFMIIFYYFTFFTFHFSFFLIWFFYMSNFLFLITFILLLKKKTFLFK